MAGQPILTGIPTISTINMRDKVNFHLLVHKGRRKEDPSPATIFHNILNFFNFFLDKDHACCYIRLRNFNGRLIISKKLIQVKAKLFEKSWALNTECNKGRRWNTDSLNKSFTVNKQNKIKEQGGFYEP